MKTMQKPLHNILVAVDFSYKTNRTIIRAINLANHFNCDIHLVQIVSRPTAYFLLKIFRLNSYEMNMDYENAAWHLNDLKRRHKHQLKNGTIEISVLQGNKYRQLDRYINQHDIDLVVLGIPWYNTIAGVVSLFSVRSLARKIKTPVLAVCRSAIFRHFKKIILPQNNETSNQFSNLVEQSTAS
jgi:nucleotide-binding universal stress UspA family protein